jgi:hypothetical protein
MSQNKQGEIHIGNGYGLTIKSSYNVVMKDHLSLFNGGEESIDLVVEIKADFESIPPEWHQTFIQMMSARYGGVIKCYDNPQIKPFEKLPKTKRRWYQFWK